MVQPLQQIMEDVRGPGVEVPVPGLLQRTVEQVRTMTFRELQADPVLRAAYNRGWEDHINQTTRALRTPSPTANDTALMDQRFLRPPPNRMPGWEPEVRTTTTTSLTSTNTSTRNVRVTAHLSTSTPAATTTGNISTTSIDGPSRQPPADNHQKRRRRQRKAIFMARKKTEQQQKRLQKLQQQLEVPFSTSKIHQLFLDSRSVPMETDDTVDNVEGSASSASQVSLDVMGHDNQVQSADSVLDGPVTSIPEAREIEKDFPSFYSCTPVTSPKHE